MPANWGTFIPNVTEILSGQSFKNPGSIANDPPRIGSDTNPNFATPDYIPFVTPGGRRDWGEALAAEYIAAVKTAQTPVGAMRQPNGAADQALILAYGEAFERLYRDGDVDLMDTKDEDGNIIKEGKQSSEAFSDLCPEPIKVPNEMEEAEKQRKKFNAFIEKYKDDDDMDLHSFLFSEFHCIEDGQPQEEVEKLFATKMIREFESYSDIEDKIEYYKWVEKLGSILYKKTHRNFFAPDFQSKSEGDYPYWNVNADVKRRIEDAGYNAFEMIDNISQLFIDAIHVAYPEYETNNNGILNLNSDISGRLEAGLRGEIIVPWPYDPDVKEECPLSKYRIQVGAEEKTGVPVLLHRNVICFFSYNPAIKRTTTYELSGIYANYNIWYSYKNNSSNASYNSNAAKQYSKNVYLEFEYKKKWNGLPPVSSSDTIETLEPKVKHPDAGTQYKFVVQSGIDAKEAAEECDANEELPDIPYQYPSGDPYEELAEATITFWYLHIIQPFKTSPPMPPALSVPPLNGFYVPIYYGSKTRLAKGLRRALNSGKSFDKVPATQPPALTVATALAAVYALHLLEFKLLYFGGIPVPTVPFVPMIGFVPIAF